MCCQPDDCRWSLQSSTGIYGSMMLPVEAYLDEKVRNLRNLSLKILYSPSSMGLALLLFRYIYIE